MARGSWYDDGKKKGAKDKEKGGDEKSAAESMPERHARERKEAHERHSKARDDLHNQQQDELGQMAQRQSDEAEGAQGNAPQPAASDTVNTGAGQVPAPVAQAAAANQ